jgi:AcrR family transcriptional regulator
MNMVADTRERLLDAAEEFFAREGYRVASLRAITGRAAVNLAAVNYHYGSKRGLLEAVFARRLDAMNQARLRGLALIRDQARAAGRRPDAHALIAAFVERTLGHARSGQGERHFMALVVRSFSDTDHTAQLAFESYMRPAFEALRAAMAEALPDLPSAELWWRLQFTIGAMIRVQHLALATVAGDTKTPQPPDAVATRLLTDFVHAGLIAPSAAQPHQRHPAPAQGESA